MNYENFFSDMIFLNQHFYIDAGIPLPIKNLPSQSEVLSGINEGESSDKSSTLQAEKVGEMNDMYEVDKVLTSVNVTDDVKVNLRKMSKSNNDSCKHLIQSEITITSSKDAIKQKRHSSVHPISDDSVCNNYITKRRSLNINTKEISKIPVILKNIDDNKINKTHEKNDEKINLNKKGSYLPIPLR